MQLCVSNGVPALKFHLITRKLKSLYKRAYYKRAYCKRASYCSFILQKSFLLQLHIAKEPVDRATCLESIMLRGHLLLESIMLRGYLFLESIMLRGHLFLESLLLLFLENQSSPNHHIQTLVYLPYFVPLSYIFLHISICRVVK